MLPVLAMVQVDVFWAYAFGAAFALGAARQLRAEHDRGSAWWESRSFMVTMLFLALLFVPSGTYLVTQFPSWETMHVARSAADLPAWLITAFTITNVTQGILGYWATRWFVVRGRATGAVAQVAVSYFGFFFILVNGWDGTGYKRFLSIDHDTVPSWTWGDAGDWVTGPVSGTLIVMGLVILPYALGFPFIWLRDGFRSAGVSAKLGPFEGASAIWAGLLTLVFGVGLVGAIAAHVVILLIGPVAGAVVIAAVWLVSAHRRGPLTFLSRQMVGPLLGASSAPRPAAMEEAAGVTSRAAASSA